MGGDVDESERYFKRHMTNLGVVHAASMDMDSDKVFAACRRGDLVSLERLLAKDSTLLHRKNFDLDDETPLHCACRYVYSPGT